jgi:hypothetical protein
VFEMMTFAGHWMRIGSLACMAMVPTAAIARAPGYDPRLTRLMPSGVAAQRGADRSFDFESSLTATDRFDLASVRSRSSTLSIGSVDLKFSAKRAANIARRAEDLPFGVDRWAIKSAAVSAQVLLSDEVALAIGGEYARMTRRLQIIEVNPHRLGTRMARAGVALTRNRNQRLALDYVSVARSSGHDNITRLAETVGGAPLTGHGPELSFTASTGYKRGDMGVRFSVASMRRPDRDLGLTDSLGTHNDARAMLNLSMRL